MIIDRAVSAMEGPCSIRDVISNKYCVGCGACAAAAPDAFSMVTDEMLTRQAMIHAEDPVAIDQGNRVCPFSSLIPDETELATVQFEQEHLDFDEHVGFHHAILTGQVRNDDYLQGSSSGGLTSWMISELLRLGSIDGVIHVGGKEGEQGALFDYVISYSVEEAEGRRKSQYYSTSFEDVLLKIHGDGLRYAFVGVPCYVKAVRLLQANDAVLAAQIAYAVGLVCGHLKSRAFAEVMAAQVGVPATNIEMVDFRVKNRERPANLYDFGVRQRDQTSWKTRTASSLVGGNWGHALFQLKACDYCDDIFAETADICFGDAWLPEFVGDWRGTNVVVSRRKDLTDILKAASRTSQIALQPLSVTDAAASQAGNFRHRREGLSVRLAAAKAQGAVVPSKRVRPGSMRVGRQRRKIVFIRQSLAQLSHAAYCRARGQDDINLFFEAIRPLIVKMDNVYRREKFKHAGFWLRMPVRILKALFYGNGR